MAQVPIIRRKPEGGEPFLLSLHVTHPGPTEPPQFEIKWDGEWVAQKNLPPVFAQQIFNSVLQAIFALGLVVCSNVQPPPGPTGPGQN